MTIEKAIETLTHARSENPRTMWGNELKEAVDMAIRALERVKELEDDGK